SSQHRPDRGLKSEARIRRSQNQMRITSISRMWCLRSESESGAGFQPESSAGFQPAVSQDFILQPDQTCQTVQVNSIGLQIKNLRYSPADAGRYAFGRTLTIEAPNHQGKRPKSRDARRIEATLDAI